MWNEAFNIGGPGCTVRQFEQLTGVRVDHYVVVDFNGFKSMVDAIGGVEVCIPHAVNDPIGHITLPAGTHKFSGDQALNYVRERHSLGNGSDIGRMKRQQAFIASMAHAGDQRGHAGQPDPPGQVHRRGHQVADPRPRHRQHLQAGRAGLPVPAHRPGPHPVRDDALGARPQRPEPRGLGARGAQQVWERDQERRRAEQGDPVGVAQRQAHPRRDQAPEERQAGAGPGRQTTSPTGSAPETREGELDGRRPHATSDLAGRRVGVRIVAGAWRRSSATYCPRPRRTSATPSRRPRRRTRATGGCAARCHPTTAETLRRGGGPTTSGGRSGRGRGAAASLRASRSRISCRSLMSSGVPGSGLGK